MIRRSPRARVLTALVAVALGCGVLVGCLPPPPAPAALSITTAPGLFPAFSVSVTDYVARCAAGAPVRVSVEAPDGTQVSVDHQPWASGRFTVSVSRTTDQAFTIDVLQPSRPASSHSVRCLPTDFPNWTTAQSGSTRAEFYLATPIDASTAWYPVMFDSSGVPVWWGTRVPTIFNTYLEDGNIGSVTSTGLEERTLAGQLVRSVPTTGGQTDQHDVATLANGNVVLVANVVRGGVDLTSLGGPPSASILDQIVEEIDPSNGQVVWSWDVADHIAVDEMDPQWFAQYIAGGTPPYDVFHWNSIEKSGAGYLLSFRHLDALYQIDAGSGSVLWKLGGTARPESLTVQDDPVFSSGSHFGGQHDARLLGDGSITAYDDGSGLGRSPRAVRYRLDPVARTATLIESLTDPSVTSAFCCGSARRLGIYDWVMGWGGDPNGSGSENVAGERAFSLNFPGLVMYRVIPLTLGQVGRVELRDAMDARAATLGAQEEASAPGSIPFPP
jgi:Arylsulfotransferase (ASST)